MSPDRPLRPMANLFAVWHRDIDLLSRIEGRLRGMPEFELVWRPAPGWVAARASLPEGVPDGNAVRANGFVFLEGRDLLERGDGVDWLDRVAHLTDHAPGGLDELAGDFGYVRFRADGEVAAVRSCGGLVPLYVHRSAEGVLALGTRLSYFPNFLPGRFRADPLMCASFHLTVSFIDGRTFVEGVRVLPRASHTVLSPGYAPRTTIYWDPRPEEGEVPRPSPDHPAELRSALIKLLERDLDPRGRNLVSLSGGVDSASLASLAAGVVGRGLSSISVLPAHDPSRAQELSYIDPLVTRFAIRPAHTVDWTARSMARWSTQHRGLPFQASHPALAELPDLCEQQEVRVLLGGEYADEVCGERVRFGDWVSHTGLGTLLRTPPRSLPFGTSDYLRWAKRRAVTAAGWPRVGGAEELLPWAHPDLQAEFRDWRRRRREEARRDHRPLRDLASAVQSDAWVAMNWEGTTPLGVRRCLPFFHREVLELAFRCHPSELLGPGTKRLLRVALRDDVPSRNLFRPDKGMWSAQVPPSELALPRMSKTVERIVRPDWLVPTPPDDARVDETGVLWDALIVAQWLEDRATARLGQEGVAVPPTRR